MASNVRPASEAAAHQIDEDWGSLCWLASQKIGNAEGLTLGRVVIKAGMSNPKHSHPNCEEALYLLKGRLEHTIGDESVVLEAGDTIVLDAGIPHNATSIGDEDADMIVAYSSGLRGFQPES
ncbi:MAG: cupin domain-containing protein [Armatimonadota bacterium]|nr:MAG: cupin domain-containing protein [Armatimonadota bacterium]